MLPRLGSYNHCRELCRVSDRNMLYPASELSLKIAVIMILMIMMLTNPVSWGSDRIGRSERHPRTFDRYRIGRSTMRPACLASSLRPISLISKSWKVTKYQQTWSTTTPNDKIMPAMIFFWAFDSQKLFAIKKKKKKKKICRFFFRFFLIDRWSEIIRRSPLIGSVSASDPMIVYRVNVNI